MPPWVRNPTTVVRDDNRALIAIEVTKRYAQDQWMMAQHDSDTTVVVAFRLQGQSPRLGNPEDVWFVVKVPLGIFSGFTVRRFQL